MKNNVPAITPDNSKALLEQLTDKVSSNAAQKSSINNLLEEEGYTDIRDLNEQSIDTIFNTFKPGVKARLKRELSTINTQEQQRTEQIIQESKEQEDAKQKQIKERKEAEKKKVSRRDARKNLKAAQLKDKEDRSAKLRKENDARLEKQYERTMKGLEAVKDFTSTDNERVDLSALRDLASTENSMVTQAIAADSHWERTMITEWTSEQITSLLYQCNLDCGLHDGSIDEKQFFKRSINPCLEFLSGSWQNDVRSPDCTWEFDSSVFGNTSHRDFYRNTSASFSMSGNYGFFSASMSAAASTSTRQINKSSKFCAITKGRANVCYINLRDRMVLNDSVIDKLKAIVKGNKTNAQKIIQIGEFCNVYGFFVATEVLVGVQATGEFTGTASEDFDSNAMAATMSASMSYSSLAGNSLSASAAASIDQREKSQLESIRQNMTIRVKGAPQPVTINSISDIASHASIFANLTVSEILSVETIFDLLEDESLKQSIYDILSNSEIQDGYIYKIKCSVGNQYCDSKKDQLIASNDDISGSKRWLINAVGPDVYTITRAAQPTIGWAVERDYKGVTPPVLTNKPFKGDQNKFIIEKASEKPGWYRIIPSNVQGLTGHCLDTPTINGGIVMRALPANLDIDTCYFKLEQQGGPDIGRRVNIVTGGDTGMIASPNIAAKRVNMANLRDSGWKEHWVMIDVGEGFFTFMDPDSGKVVDVNNHDNRSWLEMNTWNSARSQQRWVPHGGMINVSGDRDARWDGAHPDNRKRGNPIYLYNGGYGENRNWLLSTRDEMEPAPLKLYQIIFGDRMLKGNGSLSSSSSGSNYSRDLFKFSWVENEESRQGWLITNNSGERLTSHLDLANHSLSFDKPEADGKVQLNQMFDYEYDEAQRDYRLKTIKGGSTVYLSGDGDALVLTEEPTENTKFIIFEIWRSES